MTLSRICCCGEGFPCAITTVCDARDDYWLKTRAEYITVGRPRAPRVYPGRYWAAWHNVISPRGELDATINIAITKRSVRTETCGGSCVTVTPPTSASCAVTGFLTPTAGCKQTAYTDYISWSTTSHLRLMGASADQNPSIGLDNDPKCDPSVPAYPLTGKPIPAVPPGYWPNGLSGACGVGGDQNTAINPGQNPNWWAYENRKLLPRFFGGDTVTKTANAISTYPQIAACGDVQYVNRCSTTTSASATAGMCIDFPIVALPSHPGNLCDGTPLTGGCDPRYRERGTTIAMWGFDIYNPELNALLDSINMPYGQHVGTAAGAWIVRYQYNSVDKLRVLFNVDRKLGADGMVLRFATDAAITESGTLETSASGSVSADSYRAFISVSFTPRDWCLYDEECDCVASYAENCPTVLHYDVDLRVDNRCGAGATIRHSLNIGLEEVVRAYPTALCNPDSCSYSPVSCCYMWDSLPNGGTVPSTDRKYLGAEPLERAHPFWRRYRNKYNHMYTVNDWINNGKYGAICDCDPVAVYGGTPTFSQLWHDAPGPYAPGPCGTCACTCPNPNGPQTGAGCYSVASLVTDCPPVYYGACGPTVANPSLNGRCLRMTVANSACSCNPYHACGWQILAMCGELSWQSCTGSTTVFVWSPPPYLMIPWNPKSSCCPMGTYQAIEGNLCNDPSTWVYGSTVVVIS